MSGRDARPSGARAEPLPATRAFRLVLLLGAVSLFADLTYEGARSIAGPFLAGLGASGAAVGLIAGGGELIGYGVRLVSGFLSDRTGRPWLLTGAGYAVNLLAVPLLALAGRWEVAGGLMVAERLGKAIRTPPRDAMLSHAAARVGVGWGFGLHEALDQVGAVLGPVLVAAIVGVGRGYRTAFAALLAPAVVALAVLAVARRAAPRPRDLEIGGTALAAGGFPRAFWRYLAAAGCVAAATADFPLIAFHFDRLAVAPAYGIPLLYALAMAVDGLAALAFGRLFDRAGAAALGLAVVLSAASPPLVFGRGAVAAVAGMALWGIGMGAQESILRGAVARMVPAARRGAAYGVFNAGYGLAWFAGSAVLGFLYDVSRHGLILFAVLLQLAALPLLLASFRDRERRAGTV